jgi:hypothetical protein
MIIFHEVCGNNVISNAVPEMIQLNGPGGPIIEEARVELCDLSISTAVEITGRCIGIDTRAARLAAQEFLAAL